MKKLYYLLAFVVAAATFTACNPLDKSYKQLGDLPAPQAPPAPVVNVGAVTLTAADYATLPSTDYAKTLLGYKTSADAAASIPAILAVKSRPLASASINRGIKFARIMETVLSPDEILYPELHQQMSEVAKSIEGFYGVKNSEKIIHYLIPSINK